jgi:hypothetical protein
MVDTFDQSHLPESPILHYTIEEHLLRAKTGNEEENEDAIYLGPHFVAVIDGATSTSKQRWDGLTGGRIAATLIRETFAQIPPAATIRQTVDLLSSALKQFYERHQLINMVQNKPAQRATASFVALSLYLKEIWFVGDCQCLLDQEHVTNTKRVDEIVSDARSMYLEAEVCRGKTIEDLREHDTGRAFVMPLLKRQRLFQNNPSAVQYWYAVIDGFDVPEDGLRVYSVPADTRTIVLASDGYPLLKDSLHASEEALQAILHEDPLLFRTYKSTKGLQGGYVSFDDRAYVKVRLHKALGNGQINTD